jgi:hypothetical protein
MAGCIKELTTQKGELTTQKGELTTQKGELITKNRELTCELAKNKKMCENLTRTIDSLEKELLDYKERCETTKRKLHELQGGELQGDSKKVLVSEQGDTVQQKPQVSEHQLDERGGDSGNVGAVTRVPDEVEMSQSSFPATNESLTTDEILRHQLEKEVQKMKRENENSAGTLKALLCHIDKSLVSFEKDKREAEFATPDKSLAECIADFQSRRIFLVPGSFDGKKVGVMTLLCTFLGESYDSTKIKIMETTRYPKGTSLLVRGFWGRLLAILEPTGHCNNSKDKQHAVICVEVLLKSELFPARPISTGMSSIKYGLDYVR